MYTSLKLPGILLVKIFLKITKLAGLFVTNFMVNTKFINFLNIQFNCKIEIYMAPSELYTTSENNY